MSESGPRLPYGRQTIEEDDVAAVAAALRDPFLTQGPGVAAFEEALCEATGAGHAVAVSSGTAALHTAYAAAGIGPGDEIVTSPVTFLATASAAVLRGARPRFADVDPQRANLDPADVERRLTAETRATVAVDFAGHPAEYDALRDLCHRRGLRLIADASHSLGGAYRGRPVGTLADLTCLSFHPVKTITTGEGGAVLTDDPVLAEACRAFREHGLVRDRARLLNENDPGPWYHEMQSLGENYRLTDLQCALGRSQLRKLGRFVERRSALAARYEELLSGIDGLTLPDVAPHARSGWHLFVVRVPAERRRRVFEALREDGIGVQVHYIPVYRHPFFRRLPGHEPADYPEAEAHYASAITLPLYPTLTDDDQVRVADRLAQALR